ncbi:MAG TPA: glycosyltransferase family 39 protein [Polyangiaceae bacterium]|nr:glycosyltransferase family 39 protein [Polyangiaceae bacterium]
MHSPVLARVARVWPEFRADALVATVAFVARAAAVIWAGHRFPPAADGVYYYTLASRMAEGLGSTWLWPDGKVTYAAHYPAGYPAILSLVYRWTGPSVAAAGWTNALIGSAGAVAAYRLALREARPRWALAAGLAVALHPALVMYTPAVMTEGVTASLVALAAWAASCRSRRGAIALGLVVGVATLVRPQSLVLAPGFGLLAVAHSAPFLARLRRAALATVLALAACTPWTIRNCVRMNQCALVSFNGGWNLLIGAHEQATGTFAPVHVPEACRTVWDEAEKDGCFGREARRIILREPGRWLGLVPAKLAATFDYAGAPGFYLHQSNSDAFGFPAKRLLGIVETAYERIVYLSALAMAALAAGPMRRARWVVAAASAALLFQTHAYVAVLGLAVTLGLLGKDLFTGSALRGATFLSLAATVVTHAVFFGAGRYSMVVFPLVTAFAFCHGEASTRLILTAPRAGRDTEKKTEETLNAPD